jgi:hypothetical protein
MVVLVAIGLVSRGDLVALSSRSEGLGVGKEEETLAGLAEPGREGGGMDAVEKAHASSKAKRHAGGGGTPAASWKDAAVGDDFVGTGSGAT